MFGTDAAWNRPPEEQAAIVARYRPTHQFKRAWEIISPTPDCEPECAYRIVHARLLVQRAAQFAKRGKKYSPAEQKRDLERRIKVLRAAEGAVYDEYLSDRLSRERQCMKFMLAYTTVKEGKPQHSEIRKLAVHQAHELLKFGNKKPSHYRNGPWHDLARVLFGNEDADLFEYLQRYRPPEPVFEVTDNGDFVQVEDPPLFLLAAIVGQRR